MIHVVVDAWGVAELGGARADDAGGLQFVDLHCGFLVIFLYHCSVLHSLPDYYLFTIINI